jgi:hypothetical protein
MRKKTIQEMHNLAKIKGGKCLSTKYLNNKTKLKWQCADGHVWDAVPYSISQGKWCRKCGNLKKQK